MEQRAILTLHSHPCASWKYSTYLGNFDGFNLLFTIQPWMSNRAKFYFIMGPILY